MARRGLGVPYSEALECEPSPGTELARRVEAPMQVSQKCIDATERMGQEDFLYRFLYMSDPKSIFLRYYYMLHMTIVLLMPILKKMQSTIRPNIITQIRDIVMPHDVDPDIWHRFMALEPSAVDAELQRELNSAQLTAPVGTKKMVEDLFYFYMIAYLPGYMESFVPRPMPDGEQQMLRVRSYRCLFQFVFGDESALENNWSAQVQRTLVGAPRPKNTTFDAMHKRREMMSRSTESRLPNMNVEYSTVENLSFFLVTNYRMSIPPFGVEQDTEATMQSNTQQANEQIEKYVQQFGPRSAPRS